LRDKLDTEREKLQTCNQKIRDIETTHSNLKTSAAKRNRSNYEASIMLM